MLSSLSILQFAGLCFFAFLAGMIDSIAGGGGLIQLPAIMSFFPHAPIVTLLAVNKLSSSCGTAISVFQYSRKVEMRWKRILPVAGVALIASILGARLATMTPNEWMRPFVLALLAIALIYTLFKPDLGETVHEPKISVKSQMALTFLAGAAIGLYDGFFGPGTGNFLILSFIFILGMDFLHASASAKIVNLATNIGALILFFSAGYVDVKLGLAIAVFNMLGAVAGVRLAILKGSRFIRVLFITVTFALFIRQLLLLF